MKSRQERSGRIAAALVVTLLIGGCGGGGSGGDTAVSGGSTPAPSPAPAPSVSTEPETTVPATPVPEPTKPPPSLIVAPPPAAPTPTPAPGASRTSVVRALVQASDQFAVDRNGAFDLSHDVTGKAFSTLRSITAQDRLTAASTFTLGGEETTPAFKPNREVILSAAVATDGVTNYTFTGTGSITSPSGQTSISASSFSLPDPVPFDRTLHQLNVTGSSTSSVRFFVGTIDNRPELMRVCWRIELPGILRVACTRHERATGNLVGGDTVNDLGGTLYYHEAAIGQPLEVSVLRCVEQSREFIPPSTENRRTRYLFGVTAFDRDKSDGGLFPPPTQFYLQSTSVQGSEVVYRMDFQPPARFSSSTEAFVAGQRVVRFSYSGGGSFASSSKQCS